MCGLTHNSLQIIKCAYLDIRVLALGRDWMEVRLSMARISQCIRVNEPYVLV